MAMDDPKVGQEESLIVRMRWIKGRTKRATSHADYFRCGQLQQTLGTAGHTPAASTPAAKGRPRVGRRHDQVVDTDRSSLDPSSQRGSRSLIARENRRSQSKARRVGEIDSLPIARDGDQRKERREDVLAKERRMSANLGEHQRTCPMALLIHSPPYKASPFAERLPHAASGT